MQYIGEWLHNLGDKFVPAHELKTNYDDVTRLRVADYLAAGTGFCQMRGYFYCYFGCGPQGAWELTDGEWVWPSSLPHEVREHSVLVPESIIESATSGRKPPQEIDPAWLQTLPERTFWVNWCEQNRSGAFRDRIAVARAVAEEDCRLMREKFVAELEAKEGLSDERCIWQGCTRLALKNRKVCASCPHDASNAHWPLKLSFD